MIDSLLTVVLVEQGEEVVAALLFGDAQEIVEFLELLAGNIARAVRVKLVEAALCLLFRDTEIGRCGSDELLPTQFAIVVLVDLVE